MNPIDDDLVRSSQEGALKLVAILAISLTAATASADVTVMDNKTTLTVDCAKDKNVNIVGNHITVTLTGTCEKVSATGNSSTVNGSTANAYVAGNKNTLNLDRVDNISVSGNRNTITYKKPVTQKKTSLSIGGKDNSVNQTK